MRKLIPIALALTALGALGSVPAMARTFHHHFRHGTSYSMAYYYSHGELISGTVADRAEHGGYR